MWHLPVRSQMWHCAAGSVTLPAFLSGRKLSPSPHLDARHFSSSCMPLVPFRLLPCCWSSEGVSLSKSIHWNSGLGVLVSCWDSLLLRCPSRILCTTCGCGTCWFCASTFLTSLDGCGLFNSVVVRLPFSLISDSSEWWAFYSLVVMLMRLCEEASHVYLCRHLDQKLFLCFFTF